MNNETNQALENAKAWMVNIVEMVAALECDYDRLEELRDLKTEGVYFGADEAEELAELETAANGNADREEAEQAIQESPLSVEVRSDWTSVGTTLEATEFCILLSTGGPALRIVGELDDLSPSRAWLEYQDWGTPWTELLEGVYRDSLLTFCQQFYFGEM